MRRMLKNWRRNFKYNDNRENFDRMSFQSTSIEVVKDINQKQDDRNSYGKETLSKGNILWCLCIDPSNVNIICHTIFNTDGSINIALNILSKCFGMMCSVGIVLLRRHFQIYIILVGQGMLRSLRLCAVQMGEFLGHAILLFSECSRVSIFGSVFGFDLFHKGAGCWFWQTLLEAS